MDGVGEIMAGAEPRVRELAERARALIRAVYPEVVEVPWPRQGVIGCGAGPRKMGEHFCYIAVHRDHINLGFNYGVELPDPEGLLDAPVQRPPGYGSERDGDLVLCGSWRVVREPGRPVSTRVARGGGRMPIGLSTAGEEGVPSALGHPVIVCDYCGRRIGDAAAASVAWGPGDPRVSYLHGDCLEGFLDREYDPRRGDWRVGELDTFLYTLLANAGYDHEATAGRGSAEIPWGNLGAVTPDER